MAEQDENEVIEEEEEECPKCPPVGAPAWMATFADMATLLMAFFVLILSFAEFNVPKFKQISGSLKNAFGVQKIVPIVAPIRGYVNNISILVGSVISVNTDVMMVIVEDNDPINGDERFTNLEEYWAKYENGVPVNSQNQPNPVIGRSTDPMDSDTDNDTFSDVVEQEFGTDPEDRFDFPIT